MNMTITPARPVGRTAALLLALAVWGPQLQAQQRPPGVSPAALGSSCPTFSWSEVEGAEGYELALYEVEGSGALTAAWQVDLPGGSSASTPAQRECPKSGGSYAWAVRAMGGVTKTGWSELLLFEVPGKPSDDEVRQTVGVLLGKLALRHPSLALCQRSSDQRPARPRLEHRAVDSAHGGA